MKVAYLNGQYGFPVGFDHIAGPRGAARTIDEMGARLVVSAAKDGDKAGSIRSCGHERRERTRWLNVPSAGVQNPNAVRSEVIARGI